MPNLSDIKKRISTVSSTCQITHTMEMVSTAKIRAATDRIMAATPYANAMNDMLAYAAQNADASLNPLLATREKVAHATIIAVVSDRGLAGGFNHNVLKRVEQKIAAYQSAGATVSVIACGKKALPFLSYRNIVPVQQYVDLSANPTIAQARQIAQYVIKAFRDGDTDEVCLVYNHARNAADQDLIEQTILPLDTSAVETHEATDQGIPSGELVFEPNANAVLESLLPDYVVAMVYRGLLDSAAAEQGARRKAMKSATDNAQEIINTLQISYNRARQSAITTEITEIIGGAAALEE